MDVVKGNYQWFLKGQVTNTHLEKGTVKMIHFSRQVSVWTQFDGP